MGNYKFIFCALLVMSFAGIDAMAATAGSTGARKKLTQEERLQQEIQNLEVDQAPVNSTAPVIVMRSPKPEPAKPLISFEPVFGMTFSNYTGGSGYYSFDTRTGYQGGIGLLVGRSALQFETGLMYADRGGREIYQAGSVHWEINYQNRYVEVPLMLRYNFEVSRDVKLFVKGGAVAAVLQDSTGNVSNTQYYYANTSYYSAYYNASGVAVNDGNTKDYFSSTDLRWAAGLGGSVRLTKSMAWTMSADYQTSLSKVSGAQPNGYLGTTALNLFAVTYGLNTGISISI